MFENDPFQKRERLDYFIEDVWKGRKDIHAVFFRQLIVVYRQSARNRKNSRLPRDDPAEIAKVGAFSRPLGSPRASEGLDQHQDLLARNRGVDTYKFYRIYCLFPSAITVLKVSFLQISKSIFKKDHPSIFKILTGMESTHPLLSRGIGPVL